MKRIIYILSFLLLLVTVGGCSRQPDINSVVTVGDTQVHVGLSVASTTLPKMMVKSGQNTDESAIRQVDVLVFENDAFAYSVPGYSLKITSSGASFDAKLKSTTNPVVLYILANSGSVLTTNAPSVGDSFVQVQQKLTGAINSVGINVADGMMMWGSVTLASGIDATTQNVISDVNMLRAAARFDVICNNINVNFELVTIQAFRVANSIQVIPSAYPVTDPSIPTGVQYNVNTNQITTTTNSVAQLYLPESAAPADPSLATCLVIGGHYNGSSTISYYRLDVNPKIAGNPVGQILRNTRYEFDIKYVTESGYSTPEAAANNPSDAIVVGLILWKDDIKYTVYNNSNYFGLSEIKLVLDGDAASSVDLSVETDFPDYSMNWSDRNQVSDGIPPAQGLDDGVISVVKSAADKLTVSTLGANPSDSESITRYVLLQAGNLKMFLTVIQKPSTQPVVEPGPGGIIWAPGNVDTPGTFAPIGEKGMFYQWNRIKAWPNTGAVTGWDSSGESGVEWLAANDPCPSGWRVPTNKELDALVKSPGHRWVFKGGGYPCSGVWVADTQDAADKATLSNPGSAVFFPASGRLSQSAGSLVDDQSNSYYWASDMLWGEVSWFIGANGTYAVYNQPDSDAGNVRCVRQN